MTPVRDVNPAVGTGVQHVRAQRWLDAAARSAVTISARLVGPALEDGGQGPRMGLGYAPALPEGAFC